MLVGTKPREMSGKVFKSDPDRAFGRESRSLKACYELYEVGNVGSLPFCNNQNVYLASKRCYMRF